MDASNILKPVLASGELRCIGSTTYEEYKNHFEKDRALSRRFQKIDIVEPTVAESEKILMGLKPYYEEFHGVKYQPSAISAAVELSARHITTVFCPTRPSTSLTRPGPFSSLRGKEPAQVRHPARHRGSGRAHGAYPEARVSSSDRERLARPRIRTWLQGFRPEGGRGDAGPGHQALPRGPWQRERPWVRSC
jgi:ATPases with chaperone activity, ATP-binding subunit